MGKKDSCLARLIDVRNLCWREHPAVRLVYVETAGRLKNVLKQRGQIRWASLRGERLETLLTLEAERVLRLQII